MTRSALSNLPLPLGMLLSILLSISLCVIACDPTSSESSDAEMTEVTPTAGQEGASTGGVVVREMIEVEGVPTFTLAEASRCEDAEGDEALFTCVEGQFWRVLQLDIEQRLEVIDWMLELEGRVVGDYKVWSDEEIAALNGVEPELDELQKRYARMIFQRGQLISAIITEFPEQQQDLTLISQLQIDFEQSLRLHPTQPFYQTWLDTVDLVLAYTLNRDEEFRELLELSFQHVDDQTEETTRSTLIASIVGTASILPMNTQAPMRAAELVRNWDCNPDVLEANPDSICGAHSLRMSCVEWCRTNSQYAPFKAPGLAYHDGEMLARVGDLEGARRMYELAKTMPGFEGWPYRYFVDDALENMEEHMAQFTSLADDEDAFDVSYTTSPAACGLCHIAPSRVVPQ